MQPTDSVRVYFRFGNSDLNPALSGNSMSVDDFGQRLKDMMESEDADVLMRSVTVFGTASPEGTEWINEHLSRRRSEELARLLTSRFAIPDSIIHIVPLGVDWNELADSVEADPQMPRRGDIARILRHKAEAPEHYNALDRIGNIDPDGAARRRLSRHHFPKMRAATAYIVFNVAPYPDTPPDTACVPDTPDAAPAEPSGAMLPAVDGTPASGTAAGSLAPARRRWIPLALKTNMLYDAALVPNIGLELALGRNWSLEADWMYAWWSRNTAHRYWRVYGGEAGVRRWFGGKDRQVLTGHHIGLYGQMLTYDFELGGGGRMGERWTWGAGLSYGYSMPVGRHLNIDFTIGFGYLGGEYKKYHPADNCYVWESTHRLNWVGPTKAEISLVWYIDGRPLRKGGAR